MSLRRPRGRLVAAVVTVGVLMTVSACGDGEDTADNGTAGTSGETVTLGSLLPLTGDLAALGKNTQTAVQLAVDQAEGAGSDIAVAYESQDSGTQESVAQSAVQRLLSDDVDGIVGAVSSAVCLSVIDTVVQSQTPMISPACTTPQLTDYPDEGYFFRTAAPSDQQGILLAQVAYEDGQREIGIISLNNSYGQSLASNFVEEFERLGGTIVENVKYDPAARTFTAETQQLADAAPDAIAMVSYVDTAAAITRDAAQRGLLDLPWYVTDGIQDETFPEKAVPNDPSAVYGWTGIGIGTPESEAVQAFAAAYEETYGEAPPSFAPQAYDAAWVGMLAAARSTSTGESVQAEIANVTDPSGTGCIAAECLPLVRDGEVVNYQGASGDLEFDANGDPANALFVTWSFGESGIETQTTLTPGQR